MTDQEKITNFETLRHIAQVGTFLNMAIIELLRRAEEHDRSKLEPPELAVFVEFTPKLMNSAYDDEEYRRFLREMKPALDHHYAENRHHPEHFPDGVNGMNLIDLLEMLCDWKAATMRHRDGDIRKSIASSKERFGMSEQLTNIFLNTLALFEREEPPRYMA